MRLMAFFSLTVFVITVFPPPPAAAQEQPKPGVRLQQPPPSARQQRAPRAAPVRKISGVKKMHYLRAQLLLTDDQKAAYDEMIPAVFQVAFDNAVAEAQSKPPQLRAIFERLQQAKRDGDEQLVQELQEEMQMLNPAYRSEAAFFDAIQQQILDDTQKERLVKARARLERNPAGDLQPVDVFRTARDTGLSDEQSKKIPELITEFRQRMRMEVATNDTMTRAQLVDQCVREVRKILTPEQQSEYDVQIAALRPQSEPPKPASDQK